MKIRLTQIDGKLPNLALMKLSHWHKSMGDEIFFTRHSKEMPWDEESYDVVYGSSIFTYSKKLIDDLLLQYPKAIVGGTGTKNYITIESIIGKEYEYYDYSLYPEYKFSIGFSSRGCRLNCKFCVVPQKEGKPRTVNTIYDIWRDGFPKNIVLLDNDFFGQDKNQWTKRIKEIIDGGFKVSFNQGINIRLINDEIAEWLSLIPYYDDQFKVRRLYTAWDNLGDEDIFFSGISKLKRVGIPMNHLMVYMLIGYKKNETWSDVFYRFNKMNDEGINVYPMVYNNENKELKKFQRWVIRRYCEFIPWNEFSGQIRNESDLLDLFSGFM